jgi:hypothetical protein
VSNSAQAGQNRLRPAEYVPLVRGIPEKANRGVNERSIPGQTEDEYGGHREEVLHEAQGQVNSNKQGTLTQSA